MNKKFYIYLLFFLSGAAASAQEPEQLCNLICNGGVDSIFFGFPPAVVDSSQLPCWRTTSPDGLMEVWENGFSGVPSYDGNQFLELNAIYVATLYQNITVIPGATLAISFAHRGRSGVDTMSLSIGPVGGPYTTLGYYADGNTSWGYYTVNYNIPTSLGNYYSVRFNSIYAVLNNPGIGNFLDGVTVCQSEKKPNGQFELTISDNIQIFPNPVTDGKIILVNPVSDPIELYEIFDRFGKRIISGEGSVINVSGNSAGTYFIRLKTGKKSITQKLVIL